MEGKITVQEFEKRFLEVEGILIFIRAPTDTLVADYDYVKKADGNKSVKWLDGRIQPKLSGLEFSIIDGQNYNQSHGKVSLKNLRDSYRK